MSPIEILIADDHEPFRRRVRSLIESRSGWHVCAEAKDGIEAVEKARELRPHLVLMDISMPRMDGVEATRIIRQEVPESEVIIVSENDPSVISRRINGLGAVDYLTKSKVGSELDSRIQAFAAQNGRKESIPSRETEFALARAKSLLASIVDSSDDAIVSKNLDGIITSWNKSAERMFGYTADEAIGQHISLIIPREQLGEEEAILSRLRRGERIDHFETVRRRKDGSTVELSLTISPVRDAAGRVIGASKVARDITERKRTERLLRESEEQFRNLSETLDAEVRLRTRELENRNAEVLRQSEQLRQLSRRLLQAQDEERRRIARELHDSAGQTLAVLGMSLSQLAQEAQKIAPDLARQAEDSQEVVRQLHQEIRTTSYLLHPPLLDEIGLPAALSWYVDGLRDRSSLDIKLSIAEEFERLPRDLELVVFRVIQESLTNIHRHSGSKTAFISVAREGQNVCVKVQDEGAGISAEKLTEIQVRGSGVGIRGMRERIQQFHGAMNIEANGRGTTILATIPIPTLSRGAKDTGSGPL